MTLHQLCHKVAVLWAFFCCGSAVILELCLDAYNRRCTAAAVVKTWFIASLCGWKIKVWIIEMGQSAAKEVEDEYISLSIIIKKTGVEQLSCKLSAASISTLLLISPTRNKWRGHVLRVNWSVCAFGPYIFQFHDGGLNLLVLSGHCNNL